MSIREMIERRNAAIAQAREINDTAERENRALTAEEQQRFDAFIVEAEGLRVRMERAGRLAEAEARSAESIGGASVGQRANEPGGAEAGILPARTGRTDALGQQLRAQLAGDPRASAGYLTAWRSWLRGGEARALSAGTNSEGGYMLTPVEVFNDLIVALNNELFIRDRATRFVLPVGAISAGRPYLSADPADADWTTEILTGNLDTAMAFGRRDFTPYPLAKRVKVSRELLRQMPDAERIVNERLAYKFAVSQEKGFMTGSGSSQPLGMFTASANGIPTSRDVSTGNTSTAPTYDGLVGAKYSVRVPYWKRAAWIFHRDVMAVIIKIKDTTNQPIFRTGTVVGEPDTLLGAPIFISEYAPNTMTTGLYVGLFGDLSNYYICDSLDFQVQRLNELYAETNQVGFIGRLQSDGMPVMAEAFARVKLA